MQRSGEVEVQLFSEDPEARELTIKEAKAFLRNRARKFMGLKPDHRNQPAEMAVDRKYQKPALRQIAPEQARLLLVGRATVSDRGANDLMEVIFFCRSPQRRESPDGAAAFNPANVYGRSPAPDCP